MFISAGCWSELLTGDFWVWFASANLSPPSLGPLRVSLKPGSGAVISLPQFLDPEPLVKVTDLSQQEGEGERMLLEDEQKPREIRDSRKRLKSEEELPKNKQTCLFNGFDIFECPPPKTENEV